MAAKNSQNKSLGNVINDLNKMLADSYALYVKTQNYHWNVEGPNFKALHLLFEEQYLEIAAAIDVLAEIIRALDAKIQASLGVYEKNTVIKPGKETASAEQMVKDLLKDQEIIAKTIQNALNSAQKIGDEVVADFCIERLSVHRKAAWMLKSSL